MPVTVTFITNEGKVVTAAEPGNLLRLSIREKGGIPFKCGAGLCGTCKCKIERGLENTDAIKDKERNHLSEADFAAGHRMACQTFIHGDVAVSWIPLHPRPPRPAPPSPRAAWPCPAPRAPCGRRARPPFARLARPSCPEVAPQRTP